MQRQSMRSKTEDTIISTMHAPLRQEYVEQPSLFDGTPLHQELAWYPPPCRSYSRRELLMDRIVNFSGVGLGVIGSVVLLARSYLGGDSAGKCLGMVVYTIGICTMLVASAICHQFSWKWSSARYLQSFDYIGISFMIAGSYTPPCIATQSYGTLAFVWFLAIAGSIVDVYKVSSGDEEVTPRYRCVLVLRFMLMGWAILPGWSSVLKTLPMPWFSLTLVGGLLYTFGAVIFLSGFEFHLPVWHLCVITAASCMFAANFSYIAGISER